MRAGTRRLLRWTGVALCGAMVLVVAAVVDLLFSGPYTTWYNHSRRDLALRAHLIGSPERRVKEVLGPPSSVSSYTPRVIAPDGVTVTLGDAVTIYNYQPYPLLPFAKFQVGCSGGVVTGTEMFDD